MTSSPRPHSPEGQRQSQDDASETPMERDRVEGVAGWLLVYVIGSVPPIFVYSMGLSGWFFYYPVPLMVAIFALFSVPLVLILVKSAQAPRWNITCLWTMFVLMTLRSISVFIEGETLPSLRGMLTLTVILAFALSWAIVWTKYFRVSVRVRNTFCRTPMNSTSGPERAS